MKRIAYILSIFAVLTCFTGLNAQKTFKLKDLIKQQEELEAKRDTVIDIQAVKPELSIIRQQYRLERNGDFFGKNNQPYYGESYSLAIKVSGGTLFLSDVMQPWKRDADYARDNAGGNYKPSLYMTYQRLVDGKEYKPVDLEIKEPNDYVMPMNDEKSLYRHTDAISDFGLDIDNTPGHKEGYLVLAYSNTNLQDSAMIIDYHQSKYTINAKADSLLVNINVPDSEKVLGGIFVTPKYEKGGRVQYRLNGVAVRNASDGWDLQLLCTDDKITKSVPQSTITKTNDKGKNRSDKKKQ